MKGFVFTIDSMSALLLAFMIISLPAGHLLEEGYTGRLTEENLAIMHLRTGESPLALAERLGMCGTYTLYDAQMGIIEKDSTCTCSSVPYTYPYAGNDGMGLAVLNVCKPGDLQ